MSPIRIRLLIALPALCVLAWAAWAAQSADPAAPYDVRGQQINVRQSAYHERIIGLHRALFETLQKAAPDLLPTLVSPEPIKHGYQILPKIVADAAPPKAGTTPRVVSFSWRLSDGLIGREMAEIERREAELSKITSAGGSADRRALEVLVRGYNTLIGRRRIIDANIDYNWLWQRRIASDRPLFDRLTERLDAFVDRLARTGSSAEESEGPMIGFDPPPFARFERPAEFEHVITVTLNTDIADAEFVRAFVDAVETHWHVRSGQHDYRLQLRSHAISPLQLYCGLTDHGAARAPSTEVACAPPGSGEKMDLKAHVERFPNDGAVLTTGAASLQTIGNRAIVLGPHDVAQRTLAHEFGHLLGFPDRYLRGYRDLSADGFEVLELVHDVEDIMSSPGAGSVLPRHFEGLITAKEIQTEMQLGLAALYQHNDPAEAAVRFRAVLVRNPAHYGATLQLAKALDRSGKSDEALELWKKMLLMAEAARDTATAELVRTRLATSN